MENTASPEILLSTCQKKMSSMAEQLAYYLEVTLDGFSNQRYYWGRVEVAWRSWCFRMTTLTDSDLEDNVPKNNLGIHSTYCDKSQWSRGDGTRNFWNSLNEGHHDMSMEFFGWD